MAKRTAFAPGKIILSGEYAVIYGHAGIAVPSKQGITVTYQEDPNSTELTITSDAKEWRKEWEQYVREIVNLCGDYKGTLSLTSTLPIGKGMGASTALTVAIAKALMGNPSEEEMRKIEDNVNPGHSGIDFAVIVKNAPVLFRKGSCSPLDGSFAEKINDAVLIDTGAPNESTAELIAWVKSRADLLSEPLRTIGECTEKLLKGEDLLKIFPIHHRAQVMLGIVPKKTEELITRIEESGGAAKVIGAGARTGGGGIVLAIGLNEKALQEAIGNEYPLPSL